ncbi:phosphoglycerate mutase-like protein [Serendipita vermifera]|nr:phosphoglycerate mutase-like protein [Serendipita vermifera]
MESYKGYKVVHEDAVDEEKQALLPPLVQGSDRKHTGCAPSLQSYDIQRIYRERNRERARNFASWTAVYLGGALTVLLAQWLLPELCNFRPSRLYSPSQQQQDPYYGAETASFPGGIGSTVIHDYPPASPTNAIPTMFPTEVGYPGPTETGAEPGLVLTAETYPYWKGTDGLVKPDTWKGNKHGDKLDSDDKGLPSWIEDDSASDQSKKSKHKFNVLHHWGNLSPFHSVPPDSFGIESSTGAEVPPSCTLKGAHILHRHGARYPTGWSAYAAPGGLASRLRAAGLGGNLTASGALSFLNTWTYKLGTEVLTPFGRQQLFDLGVSMRMKYGSLLESFTDRLPVFRTESQDRMLASATNFALGFFGWPLDDKFLLSVTIEETGYNNTLAPYKTCPNDRIPEIGDRGTFYVKQWANVYLRDAHIRIQGMLKGYDLTMEDVYTMQMMCAYETVALGFSKFCSLFTQEEWEGFEYALDLYFWYDSGFGSPVARALGSGYVLELLSRLTKTPISSHLHNMEPLVKNPSTFSVNLTLDSNPTTFPLDQDIYVDATHEVVIVNILTALNLTALAKDGPPSFKKMKRNRTWLTSRIAPFAANVQFQLLECSDPSLASSSTQIRIILNDGVVSMTGVEGCPEQKDGMCPLDTFIAAQKKLVEGSDWDWTCHGNWTVPEGDAWHTTTGDPPARH